MLGRQNTARGRQCRDAPLDEAAFGEHLQGRRLQPPKAEAPCCRGMLCGFPPTSTHPHRVPSARGHPGCPSFWLQGERQLQSFILMSLLSRVMTRMRQETRSFSVKTRAPWAWPQGTPPRHCCRSQLPLLEVQVRQDDSALISLSLPASLETSKGLRRAFMSKGKSMTWHLVAATGPSRLSVLDLSPNLGSLSSSPHHSPPCAGSDSLSHWGRGGVGWGARWGLTWSLRSEPRR